MSHAALAKTFRPRTFGAVIGQETIVDMLTHALNLGRLHHAYLFTGTRGVGKTSLARIFAKALNCETGITATPCGICSICRAIDEGRFIDLIEVDAASRTKVEDTRSLLDNVQYAPTQGRFKIYLIDEVHMLSGHSFNALLKTLEEPPAHVKFLLATTDPQKLPVTVLSRCLQLHLKPVSVSVIQTHLAHVLNHEAISFEMEALRGLAQSAQGSVRDALSLLDQAIAQGGGAVTVTAVQQLLGVLDPQSIPRLLQALAQQDIAAILQVSQDIWVQNAAFEQALKSLLQAFHDIALIQSLPPQAEISFIENHALLRTWARHFSAEDIQIYYHLGIQGLRDLPYAPDARLGFQMTLLRMALFYIGSGQKTQDKPVPAAAEQLETPIPIPTPIFSPVPASPRPLITELAVLPEPIDKAAEKIAPIELPAWEQILDRLPLTGMAATLAGHCALTSRNERVWVFSLSAAHAALLNKTLMNRIEQALCDDLKSKIRIQIDVLSQTHAMSTPAEKKVHKNASLLQEVQGKIQADTFVKALQEHFEAYYDESSIVPVKGTDA